MTVGWIEQLGCTMHANCLRLDLGLGRLASCSYWRPSVPWWRHNMPYTFLVLSCMNHSGMDRSVRVEGVNCLRLDLGLGRLESCSYRRPLVPWRRHNMPCTIFSSVITPTYPTTYLPTLTQMYYLSNLLSVYYEMAQAKEAESERTLAKKSFLPAISPRRGIEPRSPAWQAGILATILSRKSEQVMTILNSKF